MSWLDFFQTTQSNCKINFGRGINANISPEEEELFNKSYEAFEKKDILNAYEFFLKSLINYTDDKSNQNITIHKTSQKLKFKMLQGTAKIDGTITNENLYAEVVIVKQHTASVALKRYILERNYQLTYANYFTDNEFIKLKLYLDNITVSPQKIFFPLRELALNADFDKEHIMSEFQNTKLEETTHLDMLKDDELNIKYNFLKQWIKELDKKVLTLPSNDNSSMQAFLYLNILLKIDYLIVPKYKIYQKFSKKIQDYFNDENISIELKNEELKKYILTLKNIDYTMFSSNFYNAKYTFNPIEKTSYDELVNFIDESLKKIRWYKNNRYHQVIPIIYEYIAFYSLYNYGINPVLKRLLHTLVEIQNSSFFETLKCNILYDEDKQIFSKRAIISQIQNIVSSNQSRFKLLAILTDDLNFSSMNEFSNSFYIILKNLNFEEV